MTSATAAVNKLGGGNGSSSIDGGGSGGNGVKDPSQHPPLTKSSHSATKMIPLNGGLQQSSMHDSDGSTPDTHIPIYLDDRAEKKDDVDEHTPTITSSDEQATPKSQNLPQPEPEPSSPQSHQRAKLLRRRQPGRTSSSSGRPQEANPKYSSDHNSSYRSIKSSSINNMSARSMGSVGSFASTSDRSDAVDDSAFQPPRRRTTNVRSFRSPEIETAGDEDDDKNDNNTNNNTSNQHAGDNEDMNNPSQHPSRNSESGDEESASERYRPEDKDDEESMLWKARLVVGRTVNHEYVQITVIVLILLNAIMMGLATMDWVTENPTIERVFAKIDRGFLVIFSIEVSMQLFYLGIALFQDAWLIFDLSIVLLSWSFESLQIVRAFRIFRAFRLITRVKPLRDLVLAVGAVLPRMYAIAALLLIIFYVFAVLFTELFSELVYEDDANFFRTLDASLLTCMAMMTLEWADIARQTIEQVSWAWAPFTAFIAISGFIVFNLIVAVVVEAVAVTEQQVRVMDGISSDSPAAKLEEAQERIDLLQCHVQDLLRTQGQVQEMIETMAGELLHLETERMKAERREAILKNEVNRRMQFQRSMESSRQIAPFERNLLMERERRDSQRRSRTMGRQGSKEVLRSNSSNSLQPGKPTDGLNHTDHGTSTDRCESVGDRGQSRGRGSATGSLSGTSSYRKTGSNASLLTKSVSSRSGSSNDSGNGASWRNLLAVQPNG